MRLLFVDTFATIVFFTIVAAFSELFIVGMQPEQVVVTRLLMIPMMAVTGRPYGMWRDWLFARLRPVGAVSRTAMDVVAFLSFQAPVYLATLILAGATTEEMISAIGSAVVFMIVQSRPFGLFLELMRKITRADVNMNA